MKVSREQAEQNRERVLDVAARRYKEFGFEGVGVVSLMQEAGLTHGAFQGQFGAKENLMAQACARSVERTLDAWQTKASAQPDDALGAIIRSYLSTQHRDSPGTGCVMAALGSDATRQPPSVRSSMATAMKATVGFIARLIPGGTSRSREDRAVVVFATMLGGLLMARVAEDKSDARRILALTSSALGATSRAR